jgi:putative transposase
VQRSTGKLKTIAEIRTLIRRMAEENLDWCAPKSTASCGSWLQRLGKNRGLVSSTYSTAGGPSKRWLTFLRNHREVIVALDFFTVPTVTFKLLYCFFAIEHGRRKILHINTTCHPTAEWVVQQLRETFPETGQYRYVIWTVTQNMTPTSSHS